MKHFTLPHTHLKRKTIDRRYVLKPHCVFLHTVNAGLTSKFSIRESRILYVHKMVDSFFGIKTNISENEFNNYKEGVPFESGFSHRILLECFVHFHFWHTVTFLFCLSNLSLFLLYSCTLEQDLFLHWGEHTAHGILVII